MALDTIKMQRRDVLELAGTIDHVAGAMDGPDYKLAYALKLSRDSLRSEVDAVREAQKPGKAFLAFEQARSALAQEYAEKGEGGEAKVLALPEGGSRYVMEKAREAEFDQKFAELRETHMAAINAEEQRRQGFDDFMKQEVEVKVQRFGYKLIPAKKLSTLALMILTPLFTDAAAQAGFEAEDAA